MTIDPDEADYASFGESPDGLVIRRPQWPPDSLLDEMIAMEQRLYAAERDLTALRGASSSWRLETDSCDCSDGTCSHGEFPWRIVTGDDRSLIDGFGEDVTVDEGLLMALAPALAKRNAELAARVAELEADRDDYAARLKATNGDYIALSRMLDARVDYLTDELVDAWHDGHRTTEPLRVVLGMDRVEYAAWVERRPAQDASEPASGLELPLDAPTQLAAESGARVEATAACVCQLSGANPGLHAAIRRARERGWTDDGLATAVDCFDDLRPATYSEVEP